jgi:hypothetical protein
MSLKIILGFPPDLNLVRVPLKSQPNKPLTSYFIATMPRTKLVVPKRKQLATRHARPTGPVVQSAKVTVDARIYDSDDEDEASAYEVSSYR